MRAGHGDPATPVPVSRSWMLSVFKNGLRSLLISRITIDGYHGDLAVRFRRSRQTDVMNKVTEESPFGEFGQVKVGVPYQLTASAVSSNRIETRLMRRRSRLQVMGLA